MGDCGWVGVTLSVTPARGHLSESVGDPDSDLEICLPVSGSRRASVSQWEGSEETVPRDWDRDSESESKLESSGRHSKFRPARTQAQLRFAGSADPVCC